MDVRLPLPEPDAEQPLPIVLAKDKTVVLSYMAYVGRKNAHIIVSFHVTYAHRFGAPDRSYPPCAAVVVKDSAWAREAGGNTGKHYVFTFRDETFECLADGYGSEQVDEDAVVVKLMSRCLYK